MIIAGVVASVMVGLVLLAVIGRDTWLRTLEMRRQNLEKDAERSVADAFLRLGQRCERIELSLKEHHDRLLVMERRQPLPQRK